MHKRPYRRRARLTDAEIAESARLRDAVALAGISDRSLAHAAGCSRSTIRGWRLRGRALAPRYQCGIRREFSGETEGPG